MKLELDFDKKNISITGNVNLEEFFKTVKNAVGDWKEWRITAPDYTQTNTLIEER